MPRVSCIWEEGGEVCGWVGWHGGYKRHIEVVHGADGRRCLWSGYHSGLRPHLSSVHSCVIVKCIVAVDGGWVCGADPSSQARISSCGLAEVHIIYVPVPKLDPVDPPQ